MSLQRNIFRAKCWKCGNMVEAEKGWRTGSPGKTWKVIHEYCVPRVISPLPEGLEYDL